MQHAKKIMGDVRSSQPELLTDLLRQVSRSFYLTLRVLPGAIGPQIGLAYLLARATDTVADTEIISVAQRLEALRHLREAILGTTNGLPQGGLGDLARQQGLPAERILLERIGEALELLRQTDSADQCHIREVLAIITSGQELDLRRFAGADAQNIVALANHEELDDYTYRVAGCVGEFWTRMCRTHLFPKATLDDEALLRQGVRFGQGLQWVNILRDLPRDLRQGRCYLPADALRAQGLTPAELLQPSNEPKLRPLYNSYLDRAQAHLAAGWDYTLALPRSSARVRLACAWPILIGVDTLARLRQGHVLDPAQRLKVTRSEVRQVVFQTLWRYPRRRAWQRLFQDHAR